MTEKLKLKGRVLKLDKISPFSLILTHFHFYIYQFILGGLNFVKKKG